jgi:hypothetical protein
VRAQLKASLQRESQLQAQIVAQNKTITTLRERVQRADARRKIARNRKLGSASTVASALPDILGSMKPQKPEADLRYRMPLGRVSDETGLSTDSCSKQLKRIGSYTTEDGAPVIRVETLDIPRSVNEETGEITRPHKEVWFDTDFSPRALADVLAALDPDNAPKHGGPADRNVCPDHPDAGVIRRSKNYRRTTHECAHCKRVLDKQTIEIGRESTQYVPSHAAQAPMPHDAGLDDISSAPSESDPTPNPQHAASTSNHTCDESLTRKMRHRPSGPLPTPIRPKPTLDERLTAMGVN